MAGNLTVALLPGDLSSPALPNVNYLKLLATFLALPTVVVILNVLGQLVRVSLIRSTRFF